MEDTVSCCDVDRATQFPFIKILLFNTFRARVMLAVRACTSANWKISDYFVIAIDILNNLVSEYLRYISRNFNFNYLKSEFRIIIVDFLSANFILRDQESPAQWRIHSVTNYTLGMWA